MSLLFNACEDDNTETPNDVCGEAILLDTNNPTVGDTFIFTNVEVTGNCLTASIQYGGGCGDDLVSFDLLGSTANFPLTIPAMLDVVLILDDNDDCEALVTRDIDFDLTPLEEEGYNNINISVAGWNEVLPYSF